MSERCSKMIRGEGRWGNFNKVPCKRKATANVGDKWYCAIHSPEGVASRRARLDAKYDAERELRAVQYAKEKAHRERVTAMLAFCEGVETETIATLVANGETLAKWMGEK